LLAQNHKLETTLQVRPATAADIPALMSVASHAVTAAHWSESQYRSLFSAAEHGRMGWVIEEDSELQGFLVARSVGREWEIENVAVAESEFIRRDGATSVFLEVRESNHAAREFYEKWRFAESGRRTRYYADPPEDALLYRLDLA
jgi:[ribosomal protein S18]-alanine N-acetyltransferase